MILRVDFSTLEVTTLAYLSQDPVMMQEVRDELDFHTDNAIKFLGSASKRREAKAGTFALQYGASAYGIAQQTNLSVKQAEDFIEDYYVKYKGVKKWQQANILTASRGEPIVLPNGRRYTFKKENGTLPATKIKNYPVQGFATGSGGIVPVAMVECVKRVKKAGMRTSLIMQVHDETVWDGPEEEIEEVAEIVLQTYNDTPKLLKVLFGCDFNLPLRGEAKWGKTWGDVEGSKKCALST